MLDRLLESRTAARGPRTARGGVAVSVFLHAALIGGAVAATGRAAAAVERAVAPHAGNPAPRSPEALRAMAIKSRVLVRFAVDTTGRVERGSVRVVAADDPRFADAVLAVVPSLRFVPAEARGRRVRQLVEAPVTFALQRSSTVQVRHTGCRLEATPGVCNILATRVQVFAQA